MNYCARIALIAAVLCRAPLAFAVDPAPAQRPLPTATPAAAGMSAARLEAMSEHFRADVAHQIASGYVLLVARDGKLVHSSTIGMRDREHGLPMTLETRFRLASMTKPITAVAVLMLYEEGRFQLDDPVSRYLPEFGAMRVYAGADEQGGLKIEPAKRPITIRHLLTHTAGLGYGPLFDSTSPLGKLWSSLNVTGPEPLAEQIRALAKLPLYAQPGDEWRYSYSFDVLGRLVEVVAGMPFDRFLKTRLFDPLGMRHTGFYVAPDDVALVAVPYRRDANGELQVSPMASEATLADPSRAPSGGAGLLTTADDYLRFVQMLANGGSFEGRQYLSPVTVALMASNHVADDAQAKYWGPMWRGLGYGLGVGVVNDIRSLPQAGCDGDLAWGGLFGSHWIVSPRTGVVAVLMSQLVPSGNTSSPRTYTDFRNLLFAAVSRPGPAACVAH